MYSSECSENEYVEIYILSHLTGRNHDNTSLLCIGKQNSAFCFAINHVLFTQIQVKYHMYLEQNFLKNFFVTSEFTSVKCRLGLFKKTLMIIKTLEIIPKSNSPNKTK